MLQSVSFQSAKCCATNFDLRSNSIQRNVQAIQQFLMALLWPISRFRQIGFVSGKWKQVAPTHATLYERKTSQQLFLEDWMLEKRLLHCTYCSVVQRLCCGVGKTNGQYVSTWLAWMKIHNIYIYIYVIKVHVLAKKKTRNMRLWQNRVHLRTFGLSKLELSDRANFINLTEDFMRFTDGDGK